MAKGSLMGLLSLVLMLASCVTQPLNWADSEVMRSNTRITHDDFKKVTTYIGPNFAANGDLAYLRAWRFKDGSLQYQLYVRDSYSGDWRFYDSAYDADGGKVSFAQIHRETDYCGTAGCSKLEHIGLDLLPDYLEKHADAGVAFRLYSKSRDEVFVVPAGYIRSFLLVVGQR